jgi:hypothetical protein
MIASIGRMSWLLCALLQAPTFGTTPHPTSSIQNAPFNPSKTQNHINFDNAPLLVLNTVERNLKYHMN